MHKLHRCTLTVFLLLGVVALVGACSDTESPTRHPPSTQITGTASSGTEHALQRDVTRSGIQASFEEAGFEFTGHGSLAWYTGNIWDGSFVTVEIFGPADQIEAVELTLMVNAVQDDGVGFALSVARAARLLAPDHVQEVATWVGEKMPQLVDGDEDGFMEVFGTCSFHLQISDSLQFVLLAIEPIY